MSSILTIPPRLPVMMLSGCNLFPQGLLPLHIFEMRYRMMLAESLASERMFCIGTIMAVDETEDPADCVHPVSTAGFIRACVGQPDGCSNLLLQGVQRVRLSDFQTHRPYVTAALTPIETIADRPDEIAVLMEQVRSQALAIMDLSTNDLSQQIRDYLVDLHDAELLGDLIAYHFLGIPEERHPLLEMACLEKRLRLLSALLDKRLVGQTSDDRRPQH